MASKPKSKGEQKPAIDAAATPLSNESETIHTPQKEPFRFGPGNTFGKGRPKGSRDKISKDFIAALSASFDKHGEAVIEEVRLEKPTEYLKIIASIVPKEFTVNNVSMSDMSDEELIERLDQVRSIAAALAGASSGQGTGIQSGKAKPH